MVIAVQLAMKKVEILSSPTDVMSLKNNSDNENKRKTIVFFIPGNPGTLDLHIPFLDFLFHRLNNDGVKSQHLFDIYACGHANHHLCNNLDKENHNLKFPSFSLQFQIDHKISYIHKTLVEEYPNLFCALKMAIFV